MRESVRTGTMMPVAELGRTEFEAAWRRHEPALRRLCRYLAERESDAADLVQEISLRALRELDGFDPTRPLRPWLYAIARHVIVDHLRRRGKWWDIERELAAAPEEAEEPACDPVLAEESAAKIRDAVRRLPEPYRLVILYTAWEGFTPSEISEILGVPPGRIRIHLYRALKRLEKELKE